MPRVMYLDVLDLGEPSAWLLGPELDVVSSLGVQPEGIPSLFLDVEDLKTRLEWFSTVGSQFLVAVLLLKPDLDVVGLDLDVVDRLGVQPEGFLSLFLDVGDLGARSEGLLSLFLDVLARAEGFLDLSLDMVDLGAPLEWFPGRSLLEKNWLKTSELQNMIKMTHLKADLGVSILFLAEVDPWVVLA